MFKRYKYAVPVMIILTNVIMILFLTSIVDLAISRICWTNQAREFLEQTNYVPINSDNNRIATILLLCALIVSYFAKQLNKKAALILCLIDFVIVYLITMYLNFCYTGLFLFIVLNVLMFSEKMTIKIAFMVLAVFGYVYFDRGFTMINTYIAFYDTVNYDALITFYNVINTVNQVLFFAFFILTIQEEIIENRITLTKNELLEKTSKELESLNYELIQNSEKNQEISRLKERNRMAGEIHDTIGHYVTGITMGLDASIEIMDDNPEETKKLLRKLAEMSRASLLDIRTSVYELKQDSLVKYSLEQIISNLIENISSYTTIQFHTNINTGGKILSTQQKLLVMRIVQESITNCIKYSKAENIWIHIEVIRSRMFLQIKDDGEGCKDLVKGLGLASMEERVLKINGNICFDTGPGQGFLMRCDFFLEEE